jgi:myo-inositol-1(or 4)-monophosphatase
MRALPSAHLTVMVNAAEKAAKRLLRDFNEVENLQVSIKGPSDFVSQADLRSERTLRDELARARPGYAFLMEEGGVEGPEDWAWRWVIDPLDGTTNFLHGIPQWAISIALERRISEESSEVVAGVVYAPALNELFWAEKGGGAFLNDHRLRVSARRDLREAVIATGIPHRSMAPAIRLAFARTLASLMPEVAGIRRFGAASLDLAWVAAGRFDGFWELGLNAWDVSAGLLLVREAGGFATDAEGGDPRAARQMVAANPHLHPPLRERVADGIAAAAAALASREPRDGGSAAPQA